MKSVLGVLGSLGQGMLGSVSAYVRFYSLMALSIVAAFAIGSGVGAAWPSQQDSFIPGLIGVAVVLGAVIGARRRRPDLAWLYPDAAEEWATTRPATAATIFALIVALVAGGGALVTGASLRVGAEIAAWLAGFTFVVVLVMEWISRRRRPRTLRD